MSTKRVVFETTERKKEALDEALRERGTTLTDWINDNIEEIVDTKVSEVAVDYLADELQNLEEIADPNDVLHKIQSLNWAFTDADTNYLSHGLHPYPAKFIPQIPRHIIRQLSLRGEVVWDPFGGSGTTALEALLLGRGVISSDVSPLASIIGRAKTTTLTKEAFDKLSKLIEKIIVLGENESRFNDFLERHKEALAEVSPEIPNQDKWFHPDVWNELAYLKWEINNIKEKDIAVIAKAAFSKIIIKSSYQDGETRYVSKPRNIEQGFVLKSFVTELKSAIGKLRRLAPILQFRKGEFTTADLRSSMVVPESSIDLIVTSPPYPNATDYHLYHRFRFFWLDHDPRILGKKEIGSHLRHQKENTGINQYLEEMSLCLTNMKDGLRPGRYAILVLGDSIFKGKEYQTAELVGETAENLGFEKVGIVKRDLHDTKRSFSSPARRLREEKLLILRKPLKSLSFTLLKPPYKLWDYENKIRKREINTVLGKVKLKEKNNGTEVQISPLKVDKIRRLTFTHGFVADGFSKDSTWQAILENGDAFDTKSNRKDPKYATHGLHPYKGKFYPQLAKSLFNLASLSPGDRVFDPFSGSGTVLLEGYLNGLDAKGFDLNPLANKIAYAKFKILQVDPYLVDKLLSQVISQLDYINEEPENLSVFNDSCLDELKSWFPDLVLKKLSWILNVIDDIPEPTVREFLEVCLSSIVRDVSQQDPKDLRIRRRKPQIKDAPVKKLFLEKLKDQRLRLRHFSQRSNRSPVEFGSAEVFELDSRNKESFGQANIEENSLDAIITSPPYATALPYIDTDRLSILLLYGLKSKERRGIEKALVGSREITNKEREPIDKKILNNQFQNIESLTAEKLITNIFELNKNSDVGFRRKNKASLLFKYYEDMTKVMKNLDSYVRNNGSIFLVIGDNYTKAGGKNGEDIIITSSKILTEIGEKIGWKLMDTIPITVTQENRRHNKNSILDNDIIWFRKTN